MSCSYATLATPSAKDTFLLQILALTAIAVQIAVTHLVGRSDTRMHQARVTHGILMGTIWASYCIYYFSPSIFRWDVSLPLHGCDVIALAAAIAALLQTAVARHLLFHCAIPFALQAILTPVGEHDPTTLRFWLYWLLHCNMIAISILDLTLWGYKPTWRGLASTAIATCVYFALVLPLNVHFSFNYGYIGDSVPSETTLIDGLGPWPHRVAAILALVLLCQTIMLLLHLGIAELRVAFRRLAQS